MRYDYPDTHTIQDLKPELLDKTIVGVQECPDADEGIELLLSDGTILNIGFSGAEGFVYVARNDDT